MKRILKLTFLSSILACSLLNIHSQTAVIISPGAAGSSDYNQGPIFRSTLGTFGAGRYSYVYTAADLSNAGINPGDIISSVGWRKSNNTQSNTPMNLRIYIRETSSTGYTQTTSTWANITSGSQLVYQNLSYLVPATQSPNFIVFPFNQFFQYNGGAIEIAVESEFHTPNSSSGTGAFNWEYNTITNRMLGAANSSLSGIGDLNTTPNGVNTANRLPILQLEYSSGSQCNGMPNGGTINASATNVCPSVSINLSISGGSAVGGLAYQWQISTDGITWNDIPGATTSFLSYTPTVDASYRRITVCASTNDSAYSSIESVTINPFMQCYCASNATSNLYSDITSFTFAGITTPTTSTCETYTDNTNITFDVLKNVPYNFSALIDNCSSTTNYSTVTKVYIDLNQNGTFTDPGEEVFAKIASTSGLTVSDDIIIPGTAMTGVTGMRVITAHGSSLATVNPCGTYTYGETEDYLINIHPQPNEEVALSSILSPSASACSFGDSIVLEIKNNGLDTLHSVDINVSIGGLNYPIVQWNGNVAPNQTQIVNLAGPYFFNSGDSVNVTLSNPNGTPDLTFDNSIGFRTYLALTGHYTVGYGTTNLPNNEFADLAAAIQHAYMVGICDTVYFNVKDGIYSATQFSLIGDYLNYSPGDLIVIQSESKNANNLTVQYNATGTANNYIVTLDNARGWAFKHITFEPQGTSYRSVFDMRNGTSNILIDSCRFVGNTSTTGQTSISANTAAIKTLSSTSEKNIAVTNNYFVDFPIATYFYGSSSANDNNILIANNFMEKIHITPFYSYYVNNSEYKNNTVIMDTISGGGSTSVYLGYYYYSNNIKITGNIFESNTNNYGLYFYYSNAGSQSNLIANNFYYNSTPTAANGFVRISSMCSGYDIFNNSVYSRTSSTTYALIHLESGANNVRILNNNIHNEGNQLVLHVTNASSLGICDYNNLYNTQGNFGSYAGNIVATFADWKSISNNDENSISVDPLFNGPNLHTCAVDLQDAGTPIVGLIDDIDGDQRIGNPDIGADEFLSLNTNLIADEEIAKCTNGTVVLNAYSVSGTDYSWAPNGETTASITASTPGIYIVTATTACGSISDTVEVTDGLEPLASFDLNSSYGLMAVINNTSENGVTYHWDFGDGTNSSDPNPGPHMYSATGVYTIILTVTGECGTATFTQIFNAVALNNEEFEGGSISLYPNPTTDYINISFADVNAGEAQFQIIDITGKVIKVAQAPVYAGSIQTLDVSSLKSGIYQVGISLNGSTKFIRFVKH